MLNYPNEVQFIMNILAENDYSSYLVGGCVRDICLNRNPKNYDIFTSAKTNEVINLFDQIVKTDIKPDSVTVLIDNFPIKILTMTKDVGYINGNSECIGYTDDLYEYLSRRDFTINAMALDKNGKLYDYYNGQLDINNHIIRAVGSPFERFEEDPLRMIRAIRFSSQLNFTIDNMTKTSIAGCGNLIDNIEIERITKEINKILVSDNPSKGFRELHSSGLLKLILPELDICVGFDQNNVFHDKDIFEHTMVVVENIPAELNLRLSALLHDIAKPQTFNGGYFYGHHIEGADLAEQILTRMKYDRKTIEKVKTLVFHHMDRCEKISLVKTKQFIKNVGIENLNELFFLQLSDRSGCKHPFFDDILFLIDHATEVLSKQKASKAKTIDIKSYDFVEVEIKPNEEKDSPRGSVNSFVLCPSSINPI